MPGFNAETFLVLLAVLWCRVTWPQFALFVSGVVTSYIVTPSVFCRPQASTGVVVGTMLLPIVFSVHKTMPAVGLGFQITLWSGVLCHLFVIANQIFKGSLIAQAGVFGAVGFAVAYLDSLAYLPSLAIFAACFLIMPRAMPRSFTIGEAAVVAEICAVLFEVMFTAWQLSPIVVFKSNLRTIIAIGLSAAVVISASNMLLAPILKRIRCSQTAAVHTLFTLGALAVMLEIMTISIGKSSLVWFGEYVVSHTATPLRFIMFYGVTLAIALSFAPVPRPDLPQVLVRKYFHMLALVLFVPTILLNIRFMSLAFAVAIAVFMVVESLRVSNVSFIVRALNPFMK